MSSAFGIAAVTALMRDELNRRLVAAKEGGIVDNDAKVTALPPDRVPVDNGANACLNLFLYEVAPNTGWVTKNLPSHGSDGRAVSSPTLALDLQYLLSAYGVSDMEAEILLGHAMQAFHERPGFSRDAIRALLNPAPPDGDGVLPKAFRTRTISLADQIELIRISPRYLKLDEMSKIWTSVSAHYRPSVVYQATVVLIDSVHRVRSAPPVLTRGSTDRGPVVQPNLLPPFPTLLAVRIPGGQPAAPANGKIAILGHHLDGANSVVRFENRRLNREVTVTGAGLTMSAPNVTADELAENPTLRFADAQIEVDLAKAVPATWAAGVYHVEFRVVRPGELASRTSNVGGVAIAPSFATSGANKPVVVVGAGNSVTITLTCSPPIQIGQAISLVVGDQELPGPEITVLTPKPVFKATLPAPMFGKSHLARLRVDGVDSLYIKRNPKPQPPEFDAAQIIAIP